MNETEIRFDHLAINVMDIEKAIEWFGNIFGFSNLLPPGITELEMGEKKGKRCRISNKYEDIIELEQTNNSINRDQEGIISHLCLRVDNLNIIRDRLLQLNYLNKKDSNVINKGFIRILYFTGIDGVKIELIEKSK